MKRSTFFALALLMLSTSAFAQTHPCDLPQPTGATGVAGQTVTLRECHSGLDQSGNPVTWRLYRNGTLVGPITMTKITATANSQGRFQWESAPFTIPGPNGQQVYEMTAFSAPNESNKSNPFTLTVSLPTTTPAAPSNLSGTVQ